MPRLKLSTFLPGAVALGAAALGAATGLIAPPPALAASHSDAPLIKLDPQANLTDVYSFVGTRNGTKVLNVIVHVHPFCEPGDGVIYDKFSDDARYSIHIANPNTGAEMMRYDFKFSGPSEDLKNPDTILSYGRGTTIGPIMSLDDTSRNYTQTYSVLRVVGNKTTTLGTGLLTPPPNVGGRTTPLYNDASGKAISGAATVAALDAYTRDATYSLPGGVSVFSGSREDGFFADTPGIFDLLDPRILGSSLGQAGGGVDGFKGYNVLAYAIQIPISELPSIGYAPVFGGFGGLSATASGVGVYASVSRPRVTLRFSNKAPQASGPFIQVNRMGNPLFNEVLVALRDKDNYNRTAPTEDAQYAKYAENPEVAVLINAVFGTEFATTGRADLKAVYIPDVLRVNTTTDPVNLAGQSAFSRLGFIGGDTVSSPDGPVPGGWPNGRRFGDDVVDIALTAVASGPSYSAVTLVGDNVASNDQVYNLVFPYSATPHSGTNNSKDSK